MPAHKPTSVNLEPVFFWQPHWKFLLDIGFVLLPSELDDSHLTVNEVNYFCQSSDGGKVVQICSKLEEALGLASGLVNKNKKPNTISVEWNYLGNNQEKNRYLEYLNRQFWLNQSEESLIARSDYGLLIAENFRIGKVLVGLGYQVCSPVELMSERSLRFLLQLDNTLRDWILDPFLVNDAKGNFHWRVVFKGGYFASGSISKDADGFKQIIKFQVG